MLLFFEVTICDLKQRARWIAICTYSFELCKDVHTAKGVNMQNIAALRYFPTFKIEDAKDINNYIRDLVHSYNTLLSLKYPNCFLAMHHRNKEIIIENVPKVYRRVIQGFI